MMEEAAQCSTLPGRQEENSDRINRMYRIKNYEDFIR